MRAVAEGGANAAAPMREAALTEGAILHHLVVGMSSAQVRLLRCRLAARNQANSTYVVLHVRRM